MKMETGVARVKRAALKLAATMLLLVACVCVTSGQTSGECPHPAPETSGDHNFRRLGDAIEIPVSLADCRAVSLELRWSNGRNNGSNFNVTFLDDSNRVVYTKQIFGFMTGNFELPFSTFYAAPYFGSRAMIAVPARVIIEAVSPFARPASLSYVVTRAPRHPHSKREAKDKSTTAKEAEDCSDCAEGKKTPH